MGLRSQGSHSTPQSPQQTPNQQLDITINNLPIGIILFDPNGRVLFANRQGAEFLGYSSVEELLVQEDLTSMRRQLFATFTLYGEDGELYTAEKSPVVLAMRHKMAHEYIGNFIHKESGKERWAIARANPILDSEQNLTMIVYSLTDITRQKQLEKQKENFLSIAGHELQTPVTSLKLYAQLLEAQFKRDGNSGAVEKLQKMDQQINKLLGLISTLLDVTRLQAGKFDFYRSTFALDELLNEIVEEVQRTTATHSVQVVIDGTGNVDGDRERIGQVFMNLLTNAIKYSPGADRVIIRLERKQADLLIHVQDFGIGIPKDRQEKIFEQFYQIDTLSQGATPGLGLGLYIASEIVTRVNGKIVVKSEEGKGSTFSVSLPLSRSQIDD